MKTSARWTLYSFFFIILVFAIGASFVNRGMDDIRRLTISNIDIAGLADGVYKGDYCRGRWCYVVSVSVADRKITDILIDNTHMNRYKRINKRLIDSILREQRTNVDAVAGATITSKALLKAVENALRSKQ